MFHGVSTARAGGPRAGRWQLTKTMGRWQHGHMGAGVGGTMVATPTGALSSARTRASRPFAAALRNPKCLSTGSSAWGLPGDPRAPQSAVHVSADHAGTAERTERTEPWTRFLNVEEAKEADSFWEPRAFRGEAGGASPPLQKAAAHGLVCGMRKFISTLLLAGLTLGGLVSCGKQSGSNAPATSSTASAAAATPVESTRWPHVGSDLKPDPALTFGALSNGLRYVIMPNTEPPGRASLRLYIDAGSLMEADDQRGLAHFMEHMAFNGTKNFAAGTLVEYFQRLGMAFGADTNAHTSFRETVYKLELPPGADGKAPEAKTLTDGLKMLRDTADGMLLDPKEIEKERGIILSEKLARDTVAFRTMLEELQFILPDSKVSSRMPIGTEKVISEAPRERFVDFYEKYYTPDRMVVVVVGAVDPAALSKEIASTFGTMEARKPTPDPDFGSVTIGRGISTKAHLEPEAGYAKTSFGVMSPYAKTLDTSEARLDELKRELASRMVSRRFEVLSKAKDAPIFQGDVSIQPFLRLLRMAQLEVTGPPGRWTDAVALAARELKRARAFGFTKSEFAQAKAELLAELENQAKSADTRKSAELANAIVNALAEEKVFTHPAAELPRVKAALETVTPEQCHEVFQTAFGSKDLTVFSSGNLPAPPNGETLEAALRRGLAEAIEPPTESADAAFAYESFGAPGEVTARADVADLGITQLTFKNGVRANLKKTDFKKDEVLVQVSFGQGKLAIPAGKPGLELYTQAVFQAGGLGKHSVDDLQRVLAGETVSVDFDVSEDAFVLGGQTTTEDLAVQLRLLCAYLSDPGWREEAERVFRGTVDAIYASIEHSLEGVEQARLESFLRGDDYRFAFPAKDELLARSISDCREWLGPILTSGAVEIGLVGDFDPAQAETLLAATFGALPPRAPAPAGEPGPLAFPPPGQKLFTYESKIAKGLVAVQFPTTDRSDIRKTRRLQALASIFGDKLREKVREELGESYSPRANAAASDVFPGYGYILAKVLVTPSQADKVSESVEAIATQLTAEGVKPDDVDRAIKPLLTALQDQRRSNAYWLTTVCANCQTHPNRLEWARTLVDDFKSITAPELGTLAREYLKPAARREARILPIVTP